MKKSDKSRGRRIVILLITIGIIIAFTIIFYFFKKSENISLTGMLAFKDMNNEEVIRIGAILPLSGPFSYIGGEVRNGIDIAVQDINSANERKIKIIYEDSKMNPREGVLAINKLINVDGIQYVHVLGTSIITAVQSITETKKVIITGGSITPKILENTNYTLRIFYNLDQSLEKFTEFINQKNYSRIAALYQSGEAWERQIIKLEENGINFIRKEKYNMDEKDFRTMLLKIKNSNPDLLILLGYGSHFPSIFQQINELGMGYIIVLGGLDFLEVPKESINLYKNVVFVVPSFNIEPTEKSSRFIQEYENKFKSRPTHQAAYAYDTINLLYLGITSTNGNPESVINYIKNIKRYVGVVGKIEVFPDGNTKSSLSFATYKNETPIPYE